MRRGLKSSKLQITNHKLQNSQRGYMLITLMLAMAMMTLALLAVLPEVKQQILRDREEELQHRGTAYMRAIQRFNRKLGRYPTRVEELESTNNLRFLRKRYKDPVNRDPETGKERDFKFLHQTDIAFNNGALGQTPGLGLGPGQNSLNGPQGGGLNGQQPGLGAQPSGLQQPSGAGAPTSASGDSGTPSNANASANANADANSDSAETSPSNSIAKSGSTVGSNGQVLGGGPIIGVASMSKEKSVRVFFGKNHYKDWLFIYVQQLDRGGLLVGPVNPGMTSGNVNGLIPGQVPGLAGTGLGTGQGLSPNGFQPQGGSPQAPAAPQNPQTAPQQ
jgi:type II secretory pathway pseudopilin PulG